MNNCVYVFCVAFQYSDGEIDWPSSIQMEKLCGAFQCSHEEVLTAVPPVYPGAGGGCAVICLRVANCEELEAHSDLWRS